MVSIGKLAHSQERYYLDAVARGREDYYLGAGEAPGRWLGGAAGGLGLAGEVTEQALARVLDGAHPATGERLHQRQRAADRVPGFDVTFSAPKSVSLLHALADASVARQVRDAHDAAVDATLGYLERESAVARRRVAGEVTHLPTTGFVAAAFRHRTSRAGDPALHTHVLVANLVLADDGRYGAFDARRMYASAKTASYLYKAHLRHELTQRLGVEWTAVKDGTAEIAGVPARALRAFSQRRQQIEARMHETGHHTSRAAAAATLSTRPPKDPAATPETLIDEWRERAEGLGFGPAEVRALAGRTGARDLTGEELAAITVHLAGPTGLTRADSTFGRRDVLRGLCDQIPAGAPVGALEGLADRFLTSGEVVALRTQEAARAGHLNRHTTREMLATEHAVIEQALTRRASDTGCAAGPTVAAALRAHPGLKPEQVAAVERLTTSGDGVEVLIGKAGSGKTFTLSAARQAWQASGIAVIGCSTAARAAAVLQEQAGIPSQTIARLLVTTAQTGLPAACVLVVDEAGMVGTRTLQTLLQNADAAGAKVVLVGDHRQLPEIDAGGALRGIAERLGADELSGNRRQRAGWEAAALDRLRDGNVEEAIAAYRDHDRLVIGDDAADTRKRLVEDWWKARTDGEPGIMVAATRADVDDLNQRARAHLEDSGELTGPALVIGTREFRVGDEVMTTQNDRRIGVLNGTRGTITDIDAAGLAVRVTTDAGRPVTLPPGYLEAGHLTHGYASTAHKAQGSTAATAFVLADDTIYREWAYVGLSRGRSENRLYLAAPDAGAAAGNSRDAISELTADLQRSRAKHLALDLDDGARVP